MAETIDPPEAPQAVTFDEWIRETLAEIDPDVLVSARVRGDVTIKIGGQWPFATVYGPPSGIFGAWLDEYPRQIQVVLLEALVKGIKTWYGAVHEQEMREVHGR